MAATIDERFNDTYAKSGMQPSVGYRPPFRSVEVDYKEPPQPFTPRQNDIIAPLPDEREETPSTRTMQFGMVETSSPSQFRPLRTVSRMRNAKRGSGMTVKLPGAANTAKNLRAAASATRTNLSIISWAIQAWLWLQLPMALISLVFLAMSAAVEGIKSAFAENPGGKIILGAIEFAYKTINELSKAVIGFDFNALDPLTFSLLAHFLAFFVGIATLLAMALIYQMSHLNPFFGKGATAKITTFIIAMCGYTFPFLNIFPWFIFWVLAVWRYPK